jgi:hypothetical protein
MRADATSSLIEVFSEVIRRLEANHFPYMIVGSIASLVYGEPRLTKDMDLVVDIPAQNLRKMETLFPLDEFYCPPEEVMTDECVRRGQFNLIHHNSGLKIDFVFRKNTPHGTTEFARKRRIEIWPGLEAFIAAPEDVILKKLDFFREGGSNKHLLDIKGILTQTEIDPTYLDEWVGKLRLQEQWEAAQKA